MSRVKTAVINFVETADSFREIPRTRFFNLFSILSSNHVASGEFGAGESPSFSSRLGLNKNNKTFDSVA